LTDFFLGDLHDSCLNKTNPMGSGGHVTKRYGELLQLMWCGQTEPKLEPDRMIKTLQKYAEQLFCGEQQDASEFLAYLLDILHEDLNRADKLAIMQQRKA
jgi:ubiquitin C-terminal hydrolase